MEAEVLFTANKRPRPAGSVSPDKNRKEENRMKKKLLSLALALVMCLSLAVPALAADPKTVDGCLVLEPGQTILVLNGVTLSLSNPIVGRTTSGHVAEISEADVVHLVPAGTALTFNPSDEKLDELIYMEAMINQTTLEGGIVAGEWASAPLANVGTAKIDIMLDFRSTGEDQTHFIIRPATEEEMKELQKQPAGDKKEETGKPAETEKPASAFTDVDPASPFAEAIKWAVDQKITNGKTATTFGPGDTCTRGQILTFLYRANGSPKTISSGALGAYFEDWKDIPDSFADSARWARDENLSSGLVYGAGNPCTRADVVMYLWQLAKKPTNVHRSNVEKFTDVDASDYNDNDQARSIAWAVAKGITTGTTETTFSPDAVCTRGQIVTFLCRAYGK